MLESEYGKLVTGHYERVWESKPALRRWTKGPSWEISPEFCVLEFRPRPQRAMWTYATCCMSHADDEGPLELHLFSPEESVDHVELLTAVAHYHRTGASLGLGHSVNFGRPWFPGSRCSFGLISLPYLDGPNLEWLALRDGRRTRFLWLIPVTPEEIALKKADGLEALEQRMEDAGFNYVDPRRPSVV